MCLCVCVSVFRCLCLCACVGVYGGGAHWDGRRSESSASLNFFFSVCVCVSSYANWYWCFRFMEQSGAHQVLRILVRAVSVCESVYIWVCVWVSLHDFLLPDFVSCVYFPFSLFTSQWDIPSHIHTDLNRHVCVCVRASEWVTLSMSILLRLLSLCSISHINTSVCSP